MIRVSDVAFVRFSAPDLDLMEKFLTDFGLARAERADDVLYMRGTDFDPYLHVTTRGEPGFQGVAFDAASAEDLEVAARLEGASWPEPLDGPGGGQTVRFRDPDGFSVEVVHGRAPADPLNVRGALPLNRGSARGRFGQLQRVPNGPAAVKRIGHAVVRVPDFHKSEDWYKSRFGLLTSDEVVVPDTDRVLTAFEVEDFDYWKDPWSHTLEHFTDGDLLSAEAEKGVFGPIVALGTQWGSFGPP